MAKDNGEFGGYFSGRGAGRDGVDNDFDGRPGNRADSRSYSRIYDPTGQQEVSNLPEPSNYREGQRLQEAVEEYQRMRANTRDARSGVHFFPSVGKFIVPKQNTWIAHAEMVKDPSYALAFNPDKFVYFDKIVAEEFGSKALTDPNHPDYAKYEGLRTNLAVLRNDIIGMYLDDGSFDPGDEKYIPHFITIAQAIGQSLSNDTWIKRPFTKSMSLDVANVEGVGAREIYNHLLELQSAPGGLRSLLSQLPFLEIPNRSWQLRPLEDTPYSDANLSAPPPEAKACLTTEELAQRCQEHNIPLQDRIAVFGEVALNNSITPNALEQLPEPARAESIDEARKIIRLLRNLKFGEKDIEEWLDHGTPAEQVAKAEAISRLTEIYALQLDNARRKIPAIDHDLPIQDATNAAAMMAIALAEHGLRGVPDDHPEVARLANMALQLPPGWREHEHQSLHRLLDMMEDGFDHIAGKMHGQYNPSAKLLELSDQIALTATRLRSLDTLQEPAREESIHHAREILRWLKNLRFNDKPVEEMLGQASPDDRNFMVRKLAAMADMYKNLLQEAAEQNPDILLDPAIKEANDAVGSFAHSIKLMASKEIPNSMAAAQQISADVTQMPEEWKKLHDRAVDRLVASMEGGLTKAVGELQYQQEQAQSQDEELAKQAVEASIVYDHHHRKKRRKKRLAASSTGGLTKASKRRNARDLNGDGVADRLQGLNLRGDDMIAIRELGGNLRNISNQASSLTPVLTEVQSGDRLMPDDKTFAVREREQRGPTSPNNNNRHRQ